MRRSHRQAAVLTRLLNASTQGTSAVARSASASGAPTCRGLHTSAVDRALSKFVMPAMSPTMTEGGISSWQKKEGDTYSTGDVLLEIETDKATMDVCVCSHKLLFEYMYKTTHREAQDEGKLIKILVGDGTKGVNVGKVIAITGEEGDEADQETIDKLAAEDESSGGEAKEEAEESSKEETDKPERSEQDESSKKPPPKKDSESTEKADSKPKASTSDDKGQSQPSSSTRQVFASPIAKRIALERGLPLAEIKGSGPNGRIVRKDVEEYKGGGGAASSSSAGASSVAPVGKAAPGTPTKGEETLPPYSDEPVSNMRKVIASRLTESKNTAPHYYITSEIHVDRMIKLREVFNQAAGREGVKEGTKLSVNDFIVKAAAIALREVPEVNAVWLGDKIRQYHRADISIAVSTPTGLLTPIVTDCGAKGLATISAQAKGLAAKARDGKLQPSEYQGGSFTVSNLGMAGTPVHAFTAILNSQAGILAVAGTEQKLVLDSESEKGFKAISVMKVTCSFDHRVVDGAVGSKFMKAFKDALESPLCFML